MLAAFVNHDEQIQFVNKAYADSFEWRGGTSLGKTSREVLGARTITRSGGRSIRAAIGGRADLLRGDLRDLEGTPRA